MLNSRGQESGPFELLIAVIMMSFVLIVGYQAIEIVKFNDCQQQNDKMLEDFRAKLEDITKASIQNKILLNLDACAPKKEQKLTLTMEQDPARCSQFCSTPRPSCILLRLYNPKFSKVKCVNIKPQTNFSKDNSTCGAIEGYTPVDLREESDNPPLDNNPGGISEGFWIFKNVTPTNNLSSPIICAFKQCSGSNCG